VQIDGSHRAGSRRHGWIEMPSGWTRVSARGPGPFVTEEHFVTDDGRDVIWTSRAHRKRRSRLDRRRGSTWWAPRAIGWWTAVLFAIGATCFALGALPGYLSLVGDRADGITYFVGSIFFTSAAFLQYLQAANAGRAPEGATASDRLRVFTFEPRRIDWWATVVQFAGTLFFNVTTFRALSTALSEPSYNHLVWRPDIFGCICFLVASELAFAEVRHAFWSWLPHDRSWRIAAVNLAGSIAFAASGIASYVVPDSDVVYNATLVNLGTFVGAIGFLIGALEMLPERTASVRPFA
jgi:hypothetical protein